MYSGSNVKRKVNPRQTASLLSVFTHFFNLDIFRRSGKKELDEDDIYEVLENTRSCPLGDRLEEEWQRERKAKRYSMTRALLRIFGKEYLRIGVVNCFIKIILISIKPIATGKLISYFNPTSSLTVQDAYYYASVVVICVLMLTVWIHFFHLQMSHLGLKMRASLCALLYRKALKLSTESVGQDTNGKIVTMMCKDVMVFEDALYVAIDLSVGFTELIVMGVVMYNQIGVAAIYSIMLLFVSIPIQIIVGLYTKKLRFKTLAKTDERLRRIQEIFTSIKLIKLYTWDKFYTKLTNDLRAKEVKLLRNLFYITSLLTIFAAVAFRFSQYAALIVYMLLGHTLTTEKTFIVITSFKTFQYVFMWMIPHGILLYAHLKSCMKRMKSYLEIEETKTDYNHDYMVKSVKVMAKNAKVKYLGEELLKGISCEYSAPKLIGITGAVGAGKSTFLKLLLRDVNICDGDLKVSGEVSYASQDPWLFPETIRANILFGLPYDPVRYNKVIEVCALARDLDCFPEKDQTVLSDKGLNLSKGQQARVNLARAVYKKADVYLLDDVLAALDSKVGQHIYEECVKTFLADKLVFLVCHSIRFLKETDTVLVFHEGRIKVEGTFQQLEEQQIDFGNTVSVDSAITDEEKLVNTAEGADEDSKLLVTTKNAVGDSKVYAENKESGKVKFEVYKKLFYFAGGWKVVPVVVMILFVAQYMQTYFEYYISKLLKAEERLSEARHNVSMNYTDAAGADIEGLEGARRRAQLWYTAIILSAAAATFLEYFSYYGMAMMAGRRAHTSVFEKMMGATMHFFDTHLSGNIINRLSKDIGVMDDYLPHNVHNCIRIPIMVTSILAVVVSVNPIVMIPATIAFLIMLSSRGVYLRTARNLKRLDAIARAPFIGFLNSTLEGVTTIRAARNQDILIQQFSKHLDVSSSVNYMCLSTSRAFGFWLNITANTFIVFIIFSFILMNDKKENIAGEIGVAISQSLTLTWILQWGIRQWADLENTMTSVERLCEYQTAVQEDATGGKPSNWPQLGFVEFKNVTLKYPKSDKIILDNLSFTVKPKEKIGIVGRTGAGKSSIISVLFRLYDVDGSVIIDQVNTSCVDLQTLRSKISIIPQDPIMLEGTVRSNLDPTGLYTDQELWNALSEVELKAVIEKMPQTLESAVESSGSNWSIGQRQLFCLARAVLRNNKILVLDEATANIDPKTDELVQKTVRRLFKDCTILTIAHSLGTILDYDRIMVLDFGRIVEFDTPEALLKNKDGRFYGLIKQAAN